MLKGKHAVNETISNRRVFEGGKSYARAVIEGSSNGIARRNELALQI